MKITEYEEYSNFKNITFESDAGYQVEFTVENSGDITLETEHISLAEIKECIEIIESGKLEIIL